MAYKKEDLYNQAVDLIRRNRHFFIEDVISYMGISKSTFYKYFPIESNEMNSLKDELVKNKIEIKTSIRSKLHSSTSPTALLALYKLVCSDDERRKLSMEYRDHTTNGEPINKVVFELRNPQDTN